MNLEPRTDSRPQRRTGWPALLASILATLALLAWQPAAADSSPAITDAGIRGAIEGELLMDPGVRVEPIDVRVENGVVTLEGSVNSLLAKDRAVMIAGLVRGVRSVVDDLSVSPALTLTDEALRASVESALAADAATDAYQVDVDARDGAVTLRGTIDSWKERELVETVAKSVYGVREIDNRLDLEPGDQRLDAEIAAEVAAALRWDVRIDEQLVEVSAQDGAVTLAGTVGSWAERFRAIEHAWVLGVTAVDAEGLEVESWARDRFLRESPRRVSDDEVRAAALEALRQDPRVGADALFVEVDDGHAVLRGSVDHLMAKRAAERDVRNTAGVDSVDNRLRVSEPVVQGDDLAEQVRDALRRDPWVERYEVAVTAERGRVYLDGVVDSRFEKARADDVAARVAGVELVVNRLGVDADRWPLIWDPFLDDSYSYGYDWWSFERSPTMRPDEEIARSIESQLFWSPFVDADEVDVAVDDGIATLTGTVDSWNEWRAARANAFDGGAVWVDNELAVRIDLGASGAS